MRATPLRSDFQAIVVLRIYTASVFRHRFALYVTCAGLVSLLKFIIKNLNLQWSCSKVHSTLMGTNKRARIKITAERNDRAWVSILEYIYLTYKYQPTTNLAIYRTKI